MKLVPSPKYRSLFFILLLPLVLTSCTPADTLSKLPVIGKYFKPKGDAPVTLTVWGLWEPKEVMDVLFEEYKQTHPNVAIEYEQRSLANLKAYKDSVVTRLSEGSAPDIVLVHNSWMPSLYSSLTPASDKVISTSDFDTSFYSVAKDYGVSEGKVYALPSGFDGLALVYNRDMFTEVGLSTPPATWEEFRVAAVKLTKKDQSRLITQAGASIGSANNVEHFADILGLLFAQADVAVPKGLTSQPAIDAFTFYTNFVSQEGVWSDVLPPSVEAFAKGKVAMIFAPSWQVLGILERAQNLNVGIAQVPRAVGLNGDKINIDWASFWMYTVAKNSGNSSAAWDFLKFLVQPENQKKLYNEQLKIRPFGSAYSLKSLQEDLSGSAYLYTYVRGAEHAKSGIFSTRSGNDREVDALKTSINSVLVGEKTPAEALSVLQKALLK
ncbi:MAG: extracellular solute-binding protein [Patescibacteria group bacterium]